MQSKSHPILKRIVHYIVAILLSLSSLLVLLAVFGYYFIATPAGGRALIQLLIVQSAPYAALSIGSSSGNIAGGLVLKDVEIKNWPFLGPSASINLQRVDLKLGFITDLRNIYVKVFNGRVNLANSEPLVFNGEYKEGRLLGNVYGRSLDVYVLMKPFLPEDVMRSLKGTVSDADFIFQGTPANIETRGHFYVDRIQYGTTIFREGLTKFELAFIENAPKWKMVGPLIIENGLVNVRRSIIELGQSRAIFRGDVLNPDLIIAGTAKADVYVIDLKITGTLLNPKVHARSNPYLPEDMALVVIGLGNWAPSNFSLESDSSSNKMGLKKKITDDFKLGFELEELPVRWGQSARGYSKQLEGELSITDKVSFNVAERIAPDRLEYSDALSKPESRSQGESKFYLKYKNIF